MNGQFSDFLNAGKVAVFSTPRTGSTLITFLLLAYLREKFKNFEHLDEYFNEYHYSLRFIDIFDSSRAQTKRINILDHQEGSYIFNPNLVDNTVRMVKDYQASPATNPDEESLRRLALLRSSKEACYLFRVHAEPLNQQVFQYIKENFFLFCTQRTDILDQVLSYGVALNSKVWAHIRGTDNWQPMHPEPGSLIMKERDVKHLLWRVERYRKRVCELQNKKILVYEDFSFFDDPFQIYQLLGITDWQQYIDPEFIKTRLPFKPKFGDKIKYFTNSSEIINWVNTYKAEYNL